MIRILIIMIVLFSSLTLNARTITDDYGRVVRIPNKITRIYAASPPISMSVLAFDPKLLAALNMPFSKKQKRYVGVAANKPIVGGFMGQGKRPNFEVLATVKPQVVLVWGGMSGIGNITKKFSDLGIPVIYVKNDTIRDLISQFQILGEISGEYQRAKQLIAYTKETLSLIKRLQPRVAKYKKVHFYFAEGLNGLRTECGNSFHIQPFKYAGALNAIHCKMTSAFGMQKISLEKVIASNPDVVVAMNKHFAKEIYKDDRWNQLRAVKEHKVLYVPNLPFNYITRPPSFMRLMGIRWLIHSFYPKLIPNVSLQDDLQRFQKLFFQEKR